MKNIIIIILVGIIGFLTYDYIVKSNELGVGFWQDLKQEDSISVDAGEPTGSQVTYENLKVPVYEDINIPFEIVQWEDVTPLERTFGDIWFYTEENHNELISDDFDWTRHDVLLLYITNQQFKGQEIIVEELSTSAAPGSVSYNLVLDFKETNNSEEPAKVYIVVEKDSLRGNNGELKLSYRIYDTSGNMINISED